MAYKPGSEFLAPGAEANDGWGLGATQFGVGAGQQGVLGDNPTYGGMLGFQAAHDDMLADRQDNRAERQIQMQEETQGWKRDDIEKENTLQAGMAQAAQDGGYEGVISYLEKANPERAIAFTKAKLSLDKDIMNNEVMKFTSKRDIADAMVESYGTLGKMGYALLGAPPEKRQEIYDQMLPVVKTVIPNAPESVEGFAPIALLAAAQASPISQMFKYGKEVVTNESNVGKIDTDIKSRLANGVSMDDPGIKALVAQRDAYQQSAILAQAKQSSIQLGNINKEQETKLQQQQANRIVSGDIAKASKENIAYFDNIVGLTGSLETLLKDPTSPQAQANLGLQFATAYQKGALTERDVAVQYSEAGLDALGKKVWGLMNGEIINLTADEISNITDITNNTITQKLDYQKQIESQYLEANSKHGSLVQLDQVVLPSQRFMKYKQENIDTLNTAKTGELPPNIQQMVEKAVNERGYKPDEALAIGKKMYLDQLRAQQQHNKPTITPQAPEQEMNTADPSTMQMMQQIQQNQQEIRANEQALSSGGY